MRTLSGLIIATVLAAEVVINKDKYENKLDTARKISSFIARSCGLSTGDLTPTLSHKFTEFSKEKDAEDTPAPEVPLCYEGFCR